MDNELIRFGRAFQSEDDLIKAIASLLRRRPGVSTVAITDGTHERGKDIVFCFTDVAGRPEYQASVVKNAKIAGTAGSSNSPTTIIAQARQALTAPYHAPDGTDQYVSHVHIMSPYEIPQSSLYAIQGELKGQVSFCCGGQLLQMFNDYWPDYLLDSGTLGIYVTQLRTTIDRDDPVAILFNENNLSALRRTYIEPCFHIAIRSFSLTTEAPSISDLTGDMSLQNARGVVSKLRAFMSVGSIEHFWVAKSKAERDEFSAAISKFHRSVHQLWTTAYEKYERAMLITKGDPVARSAARVQIEWRPEDRESLTKCLRICQEFITYIKTLIHAVNAFAGHASMGDLNSTEYLKFCELYEVASSSHGIVVTTGNPRTIQVDRDFLRKSKAALITGAAGHGKSSFCYHYAKSDASELISKKATLLPVYVKLHGLAARNLGSYEEEFFSTTELKSLVSSTNREARQRIQRIRVYLDGLDEIPRVERQREILELAKLAVDADPRIEVTVTARDYVTGPWLTWMPRVHLSELNETQVSELVSGLLSGDKAQVSQFHIELQKVPSLASLMPVPLLATLIVSVFKKRTTLPETRVELYDIFLKLMCGGWDLAKNVRRPTEFGSRGKMSTLTRLAGHLHLNKLKSCTTQDVKSAVLATNPSFSEHTEELIEEIVQDGILTRSGTNYEFRHLSFQEYLAARDLNVPWDQKPELMVRWYLDGEDWWYQVLTFYLGMLGKPPETEAWIMRYSSKKKLAIDPGYAMRVLRLIECIEESCPGGYKSAALIDLRSRKLVPPKKEK